MAKHANGRSKPRSQTARVHREDELIEGSVYFTSLTVQNLRCFGDEPQTLNLAKADGSWSQWTIVLGNNGTGKSTLLQILALVSVMDLKKLQEQVPSTKSDGKAVKAASIPEFTIGIDPNDAMIFVPSGLRRRFVEEANYLQPIETSQPITLRAEVRIEPSSASEKESARPVQIPVSTTWNLNKQAETIESLVVSATGKVALVERFLPRLTCLAYGAWRHLGRSTLVRTEETNDFGGRAHLFHESADLLNAEEWLLRLELASSQNSPDRAGYRTMFAQVKAALLSLLLGVTDIRTTVSGQRRVDPHVEFLTEYGWVQMRGLGYGYQTLIAWVVDFAARMFETYPDSEQPLSEPAVCLVDEIDLHLHPTWQRKVMRYLSELFPRTQFIVTAHSPLIVQAAPELGANVAVLRQEGDHVVILNDPIDVKGWRADQILASELFDEVPLRADPVQAKMNERTALLTKSVLTKKEKARLKVLDETVNALPVGSTKEDRSVAEQLKVALDLLNTVKAQGT